MNDDTPPDLTHWKTVMEFTVEQAALLVAGIDPFEYSLSSSRASHHPNWKRAHGVALGLVSAIRQGTLPTVVCQAQSGEGFEVVTYVIKHNDRSDEISMQDTIITRASLIGWIDAEKVPVVGRKQTPESIQTEPQQPASTPHKDVPMLSFGGHESDGLLYVGKAIEQLWATYDPDDPDTAPSKKEVVEYLKSQGATQNLAMAADRVCRPISLQQRGLRQNRKPTR